MAWEKLSLSRRNSAIPLVGLSLVWAALVIAGAVLTNFDEPYLPFAIAGVLVFFLRGAPSRWEIYAWLSTSLVFVKIIHFSQIPFWVLRVAGASSILGFGALVLLGLRALWSEREGRENALALAVPALLLIVFIFVSGNALRFSGSLNPQTDDAWLYAFDGSMGFQPSFFMGRIMFSSIILTRSAILTYLSLPFAMAVVCAWQIPVAARRISWYMLTVLSLAGVVGFLLYNVVPGTGPLYAFGRDFPSHPLPYKDLLGLSLQKMSIPLNIPRNAMPSLHVGWVMLLWWNSRGLPRVVRTTVLLYLVLTVVATMGGGQHYFVDLVVSLPFVLAIQSMAALSAPNRSRRIATAVAGFGLTMAWLLLLRFGVSFALKSPVIPWALILATIGITFGLESWISKSNSSVTATEGFRLLRQFSRPPCDERAESESVRQV
jgi:hypothetical protein